jgi:hypothetical protein
VTLLDTVSPVWQCLRPHDDPSRKEACVNIAFFLDAGSPVAMRVVVDA